MRYLRLDHFSHPIVPHLGQASENRRLAPVESADWFVSAADDSGNDIKI
jgi:hypothetical protein